jgi:hypothetical protein
MVIKAVEKLELVGTMGMAHMLLNYFTEFRRLQRKYLWHVIVGLRTAKPKGL